MQDRIAYNGLTFDDVLLEPGYSEVLPNQVEVSTWLTRNIKLNVPILSSPMDTVTESDMAIALAQEGGFGHHSQEHDGRAAGAGSRPGEAQRARRDRRSGHAPPSATDGEAAEIMDARNIGGVPITENGVLKGILTRRDLRFLESKATRIAEVMTKDKLVTAPENTGLQQAQRILRENKVEKLLLVDEKYQLKGLITIKDIDKNLRFPSACKDPRGRLRVGAAVGVNDFSRVEQLIDKGVDVVVVDSAHGHSKNVIDSVREIKRQWKIDVIAGNIATTEGAKALRDAGADAIKVGIGPGSICTTRIISGVGVPQLTAVASAAAAVAGSDVPIIADGGFATAATSPRRWRRARTP